MQPKQFYEFSSFRVDVAERLLLRNGEPLSLPPKVFETLLVLVENSGHLLEKEDLMKRVWPDTFVEEANLANNISMLRRVLTGEDEDRQFIETVPKRGYRFMAGVKASYEEIDKPASNNSSLESQTASEQPRQVVPNSSLARKVIPLLGICLVLVVVGYYVFVRRPQPPDTKSSSVRSIAVLPFKPLVEASRDEVLELGVADSLITRISNIRQITVRPIGAVRRYADQTTDALAAGREQQVDAVLDGNIQKSGDKIRVSVRLLRVADEVTLWAAHFDQQYTDLFGVQDAISNQVAAALIVKLTGEEKQALAKHSTENIEAYQLYMKGRYFWSKFTLEGLQKSIEYYNQALEKDPNYAMAYLGLGSSYVVLGVNYLPPRETMPKARAYAVKALELDKQLVDAYWAQAAIKYFFDWDWAGAESEFKHAFELGPSDEAAAHELYGYTLWATGRLDEALIEMKRAQELDPLSLTINEDVGVTYYYARKYDQAIEQQQKGLDLDPNFFFAHVRMSQAYEQKGMYKEAIDRLSKARTISGEWPVAVAELGCAYAMQGEKSKARDVLSELKSRATKEYIDPYLMALVYTSLDEKDQAFEWLEKAFEARSPWMTWLKVEPKFDRFRSDQRFRNLLQRVGLPQ